MSAYSVGDTIVWQGQPARIAVVLEHPAGYIIEYTVTGGPEWGKTKVVREGDVSRPLDLLFKELRQIEARRDALLTAIAKERGERQ